MLSIHVEPLDLHHKWSFSLLRNLGAGKLEAGTPREGGRDGFAVADEGPEKKALHMP